jgi:hypothetical protein
MRPTKIYKAKLLATGLAAAFLGIAMISNPGLGQRKGEQEPSALASRDLSVDPPDVESISIKLLDRQSPEGNALLKVRYVKSERERIGRQVPVQLERRQVILRDDGQGGDEKADDGIYSAVVDFDLQEFNQQQRLLQSQKEKERLIVPIFKGRELVAEERVPIIDASRLKAGQEFQLFPFFPPAFIDKGKSLMITDLSVVKDPSRTFDPCTNTGTPMGKWTFGRLMKEMANQSSTGVNPSTFVRNWLKKWENNQLINGFTVNKRQAGILSQIIIPWQIKSGGLTLNLAKAPFKLAAIVNRVDLRSNPVYGGSGGNAGEARFIFGAVGPNCQPLPFAVIFEYGVPKSGCLVVKLWGKQWANLSSMPFGPAFNTALESITDQFSLANANPSKPNGSALNQLRTNEIALASPWELREFVIKASHQLEEDTVKQTPDLTLNNTATLTNFINPRTAQILANNYTVPLTFPGATPFRGGSALVPSLNMHWNAPGIVNLNARFIFSENTCNSCHARETGTRFLHVDPQVSPAGLSGFLTGITVTDPVQPLLMHHFDDLARRATDLSTLANGSCIFQIDFETLRMVH